MAYSKCAASVDKGLAKSDMQGDWSVPRVPLRVPGRNTGRQPGLPDPPVTRVEKPCVTGNDVVRKALLGSPGAAFDVALVMDADKLRDTTSSRDMLCKWEAMPGDYHSRGGVAGGLRTARAPVPARVARDPRAHGDGGGEEPPPRG